MKGLHHYDSSPWREEAEGHITKDQPVFRGAQLCPCPLHEVRQSADTTLTRGRVFGPHSLDALAWSSAFSGHGIKHFHRTGRCDAVYISVDEARSECIPLLMRRASRDLLYVVLLDAAVSMTLVSELLFISNVLCFPVPPREAFTLLTSPHVVRCRASWTPRLQESLKVSTMKPGIPALPKIIKETKPTERNPLPETVSLFECDQCPSSLRRPHAQLFEILVR